MDNDTLILNQENNEKLELYQEIIKNNYDTTNILSKTELSPKEIPLFAYGLFLQDRTQNQIIQQYINSILVGKLSLKRQSRKEANDISKALLQNSQEESQKPSMMEHLFGAKRQY